MSCRWIHHQWSNVPIPTNDHQIRFADQWPPSLLFRRPGYLWSYPLAKTFLWLRERTPLPKVLQVWPMFETNMLSPNCFQKPSRGRFLGLILKRLQEDSGLTSLEHDTLSQFWVFPVRDLDLIRREMRTKTSGHESTRFKESLSFSCFFLLLLLLL